MPTDLNGSGESSTRSGTLKAGRRSLGDISIRRGMDMQSRDMFFITRTLRWESKIQSAMPDGFQKTWSCWLELSTPSFTAKAKKQAPGHSIEKARRQQREEGKFTLRIFSIDPELLEAAHKHAQKQNSTFAQFVRDLIDESPSEVDCPPRAKHGTYSIPVYIRMPTHTIERIKEICSASKIGYSALLSYLIKKALRRKWLNSIYEE